MGGGPAGGAGGSCRGRVLASGVICLLSETEKDNFLFAQLILFLFSFLKRRALLSSSLLWKTLGTEVHPAQWALVPEPVFSKLPICLQDHLGLGLMPEGFGVILAALVGDCALANVPLPSELPPSPVSCLYLHPL